MQVMRDEFGLDADDMGKMCYALLEGVIDLGIVRISDMVTV